MESGAWTRYASIVAVVAAVLPACSSVREETPPEEDVTWPASASTEARLGVRTWSLHVAPDGATVDLAGLGAAGEVLRGTLRRLASDDPNRAHHVLSLPDGEIEFMPDGTLGKNTLVADWATSKWEPFLLTALVDRVAAADGLVGSHEVGCRAGVGEALYWAASQAAFGCTSPGDPSYRSHLPGVPYESDVGQSGNFEHVPSRCAASTAALARANPSLACSARAPLSTQTLEDDKPKPVQLVSWARRLLDNACVVGVAAVAGVAGGATYWVCSGAAVVASGAGCTLVAPGVGTVACGVGGGAIAQPVCAGGGVAVAAGAAAAGLQLCNIVKAEAVDATRIGLREFADAIPREYPCQSAFARPPDECTLRAAPPPGWFGPFHRLSTPVSGFVDKCAAQKCELWGAGYRGGFPCAQAYFGPLPEGAKGFEFYTDAGNGGSHPTTKRWCAVEATPDPKISLQGDYGAIKIAITKVR
jgi:hypothetical protein